MLLFHECAAEYCPYVVAISTSSLIGQHSDQRRAALLHSTDGRRIRDEHYSTSCRPPGRLPSGRLTLPAFLCNSSAAVYLLCRRRRRSTTNIVKMNAACRHICRHLMPLVLFPAPLFALQQRARRDETPRLLQTTTTAAEAAIANFGTPRRRPIGADRTLGQFQMPPGRDYASN